MGDRARALGRTGVCVFEVAFGAWAIGGSATSWAYGPTDDATSLQAVQTAVDHGCDLFDTADCYGDGHSETLLGRALQPHRGRVVIATKVGYDFYHGSPSPNFHPAYLRFALHQSLRRLRTDYVDLYQLHNPPPDVLWQPDVIAVLEAFRAEGKVRWIGVSAGNPVDGLDAIQAGWPEVVQLPYNLLAPEAEQLFPLAVANGVGVLAREALANGLLSGKYGGDSRFPPGDIRSLWPSELVQHLAARIESLRAYCRPGETLVQLALRFALESRAVSAVICGCKTPSQVRENFAANRWRERAPTSGPTET